METLARKSLTLLLVAAMVACASSDEKTASNGTDNGSSLGGAFEDTVGTWLSAMGPGGGGGSPPVIKDLGSGGGGWSNNNLNQTRIDSALCPMMPTSVFRTDTSGSLYQTLGQVESQLKGRMLINQYAQVRLRGFFEFPIGYKIAIRGSGNANNDGHQFLVTASGAYDSVTNSTTFRVQPEALDDATVKLASSGIFAMGTAYADVFFQAPVLTRYCDPNGIHSLTLLGQHLPIPRVGNVLSARLYKSGTAQVVADLSAANYTYIDPARVMWDLPAVSASLTGSNMDIEMIFTNPDNGHTSSAKLLYAFRYGIQTDAPGSMLKPSIAYYCVTPRAIWEQGGVSTTCSPTGANAQGLAGNNETYAGDILTIVGSNFKVDQSSAFSADSTTACQGKLGDTVLPPASDPTCYKRAQLAAAVRVGGKDSGSQISERFVSEIAYGSCAAGHSYLSKGKVTCDEQWQLFRRDSACTLQCNPSDPSQCANYCSRIHVKVPYIPLLKAPFQFVNALVYNPDGAMDSYGTKGPQRKLKYMGGVYVPPPPPPEATPIPPPPVVITQAVANGTDRIDVTFTGVRDDPNAGDLNYNLPVASYDLRSKIGSNLTSATDGSLAKQLSQALGDFDTFDLPISVSITGLSAETTYCFTALARDNSGLMSPFYGNYPALPNDADGVACARTLAINTAPQVTELRQIDLLSSDRVGDIDDTNAARLEWREPDANSPPRVTAELVAALDLGRKDDDVAFANADFASLPHISDVRGAPRKQPGELHSVLITGLTASSRYQFALRAADVQGLQSFSNHLLIQTADIPIITPTPPTPTPVPDGRGSFFSVSANLPLVPDPATGELYPYYSNIENGLLVNLNADPSSKASWMLLADDGRGLVVEKVAEPKNTFDANLDGVIDARDADRRGRYDDAGTLLPDGFADIIVADMHGRRALNGAIDQRCLGAASPSSSKDDLTACNFRDANRRNATTDVIKARINNDLLDDIVVVTSNISQFNAVYLNSGSDTCSPFLGSGTYDEPDGIPCFNKVYEIPTPYTARSTEKLQDRRVRVGHALRSQQNGPVNLIATVGGPVRTGTNEPSANGGLRIYQNLCADALDCSNASFVDVTNEVVNIPDPGANSSAILALPMLASDVAFADLTNDGVTDMIVTRAIDEVLPNDQNKNLFFVGSSLTVNGKAFVRFTYDANAFGLPAIAMDRNCASSFVRLSEELDGNNRPKLILIGNRTKGSPSCEARLFKAETNMPYQTVTLPTMVGIRCENGALHDVDGNGSIDVAMACGLSDDQGRYDDSARFFKGARLFMNNGTNVFSSPDDAASTKGDLYQSTTVTDASGNPKLEPMWNPATSKFLEEMFDTWIDTAGDVDGHFNAVTFGDLNGDGHDDLMLGTGLISGYARPDASYVQMIEGVDYCAFQGVGGDPNQLCKVDPAP